MQYTHLVETFSLPFFSSLELRCNGWMGGSIVVTMGMKVCIRGGDPGSLKNLWS